MGTVRWYHWHEWKVQIDGILPTMNPLDSLRLCAALCTICIHCIAQCTLMPKIEWTCGYIAHSDIAMQFYGDSHYITLSHYYLIVYTIIWYDICTKTHGCNLKLCNFSSFFSSLLFFFSFSIIIEKQQTISLIIIHTQSLALSYYSSLFKRAI